jgi:ribonuclease HI
LGSERRTGKPSAAARRIIEQLLTGRSLDELAPRGSVLREEVEAHLIASLGRASGAPARPDRAGRAGRTRPAPARKARAAAPADRGVVAYSDGASRGNPGPAAVGVRILAADGTELWSGGRRIGRATNNVAEYLGALTALEKASELGVSELELRMDSELVVRQLEGTYRVKEPTLASLKREIDALIGKFRSVRFRHVPREENRETDRLANEALDAAD